MCGSEEVGGLGTEVQMNDSTHWGQSEVFEVGSERQLTPMPTPCCAQLRDDALGGYIPAIQRGQMASRGGLVSMQEVPGNVPNSAHDRRMCAHGRS